jgi:hypothetical protein
MITPEHKYDLLKTAMFAVPATIISLWALMHHRRQTKPRLEVLLSLIYLPTVDGRSILRKDEWPGIVVRNQSSFPLRICNVGFCVGKKYFEFGRPLGGDFKETTWPYEIAPRARMAFYRNESADYGHSFVNAISPDVKGKLIWEAVRGYAMTECAKTFVSRKLSRKGLRRLRKDAVDTPAVG